MRGQSIRVHLMGRLKILSPKSEGAGYHSFQTRRSRPMTDTFPVWMDASHQE